MITYGYSIQGKNHALKRTPCQDAHRVEEIKNGWYIAAIADGVGSATNSKQGAEIAVNTVVEFCIQYMPIDYSASGMKSMIMTAFNAAMVAIRDAATLSEEPIESYDTTLTLAIFDGHQLVFGHSGDGGIIAMDIWGNISSITSPQKGNDGVSVIPLRAGEKYWIINSYEEELSGVVLLTDGLYDAVTPYLLRFSDNNVYIPMALMYFAAIKDVDICEYMSRWLTDEISEEQYNNIIGKYLAQIGFDQTDIEDIVESIKKNNYPINLAAEVMDDKTAVAIINEEEIVDKKDKLYYVEPFWEKYQLEWNRRVYPHLYEQINTENS